MTLGFLEKKSRFAKVNDLKKNQQFKKNNEFEKKTHEYGKS